MGNMGLYDYRNYVTKVANNRQIMFDCEKGYVLADGPQGMVKSVHFLQINCVQVLKLFGF